MAFSIMLVVSFYIELFDEVGDYDKRRRHYGAVLVYHSAVALYIEASMLIIKQRFNLV